MNDKEYAAKMAEIKAKRGEKLEDPTVAKAPEAKTDKYGLPIIERAPFQASEDIQEGVAIAGKKLVSTWLTRMPAQIAGLGQDALKTRWDGNTDAEIEAVGDNPNALERALSYQLPFMDKVQQHIDEVRNSDTGEGTLTKEYQDKVDSLLNLKPEDSQFLAEMGTADPFGADNVADFMHESLRLVTSQGEVFMNLALPGNVGFLGIWQMMRDETAQSLEAKVKKEGGEWHPEEHKALLDTAATVRGVGEFAVGKAITLAGATGRSGLKSVVNKLVTSTKNTKAGVVLKTGFTKVLEALSEGEEERFSSIADAAFVNLGLDKEMALTGDQYNKYTWDEMWEMGKEPARVGRTLGILMQGAGTPAALDSAIKEQKAQMLANPLATPEVDSLKPLDRFALEFNIVQNVSEINEEAVNKTKAELYNRISTLPDADFLKMSQAMGIEPGMDRKAAILQMVDHPYMLVGQHELLTQNRDNIIDNSQLGAFDKFLYRTISDNKITKGQIIGVRSLFEGIARDAGFENVNEFWEARGGEFEEGDIVLGKLGEKEPYASPYKLPAYLAGKLGLDKKFVAASKDRALQLDKLRDLGPQNKQRVAVKNLLIFDLAIPPKDTLSLMYRDILEGVKELEASGRLEDIKFDNPQVNTLVEDIISGKVTGSDQIAAAHSLIYGDSKIMEGINKRNPYVSAIARNLWNVGKLRLGLSITEHGSTAQGDAHDDWKNNSSPFHRGHYEAAGLGNAYTWDFGAGYPDNLVAQHEAGHGTLAVVAEEIHTRIRSLSQGDQARIEGVATKLYRSPAKNEPRMRSFHELFAMYTSGNYNDKSFTVEQADQMVEEVVALIDPELVDVLKDLRAAERIKTEVAPSGRSIYYQTASDGTLKGSMEWKEGKFIIRLLQDADINTLAHEFAHVFSPYMTPEMVAELAREVTGKIMINENLKERKGRMEGYRNVWDMWVNDTNNPMLKVPRTQRLLQEMQEQLATNFEIYLGTDRAPNHTFADVFEQTKRAYSKYYKNIMSSGVSSGLSTTGEGAELTISPKMADIFDRMIAGENILQRPVSRTIDVADENGEVTTFILHETKVQSSSNTKLQQYLEKWDASKEGGLQDQVTEYVKMMLGRVTPEWQTRIEGIGNLSDKRTGAYAVMKDVDKVLLRQEQAIRKKRISSIKEMNKRLQARDTDVNVSKLANDITDKLNLKPKKGQRLEELLALADSIKVALKDGKIPKDLYDITPKQLADLRNLSRRDINDLTTTELLNVEYSLEILADIETVDAENFVNEKRIRENKDLAQGKEELDEHWMKDDTRHEHSRPWRKWVEDRVSHNRKALHTLEMLADGDPNSLFGRIHSALLAGDRARAHIVKITDKALTKIFKDVDIASISDIYGKLDDSQKVKVNMEVTLVDKATEEVVDPDTGDTKTVTTLSQQTKYKDKHLSVAEIMYFYGQWMNPDGRKALQNGVIFRNDTSGKFHLTNEQWVNLFNGSLTDEHKQKVLDLMQFYKDGIAPEINRESKKSVGREIAQLDMYLPMFRMHQSIKELEVLNLSQLATGVGGFTRKLLAHMDFTHTRSNSTAPLYVTDIFEGVTLNVSQVSQYVGFVNPLNHAKAMITGTKETGTGGIHHRAKSVVGRARMDSLESWLRALESPPMLSNTDEKWLTKSVRRAQRGILGLSQSIASLQTLSAPLGMKMAGVPQRYIAAVIGKGITDPTTLGSSAAYSMEQMGEESDIMYDRFRRNLQMSVLESGLTSAARQKFGQDMDFLKIKNPRDALAYAKQLNGKETFMINYMDAWAISKIREAVEMWGNAEGWTHEQKISKWEEIVTDTQPMSNRLYQSNFLATAGPLQRVIFGLFQLPIDQYRGLMAKSAHDLRRAVNDPSYTVKPKGNTVGDQKKARAKTKVNRSVAAVKAVDNMTTAVFTTAFTAAVVQEMWAYIRDDDEDKELMTQERLISLITKTSGNMMMILDPIIGALGAGGLNAAIKGWGVSTFSFLPTSVLDVTMNEVSKAKTAIKNGDIKEGSIIATRALGKLLLLSGTGISNAERDARAVLNTFGEKETTGNY